MDEYQCQFRLENILFYTNAILIDDKTLKCLPPVLNHLNQG
jgi:hypothetical protein